METATTTSLTIAVMALGLMGASAEESSVAVTVRALVDEVLEKPVPPLGADEAIGLAVVEDSPDSAARVEPGPGSELSRIVLGLARARIEAGGGAAVVPVGVYGPGLEAVDRAARAAGAEVLLLLRVERAPPAAIRLRAELRTIDRGLWVAPPASAAAPLRAYAARTLAIAEPVPVPEPPRKKTLPEKPEVLGAFDEDILALCACDLAGGPEPELVALSLDRLAVFALEAEGLGLVAARDLEALPRSSAPSREPIGGVVCRARSGPTAGTIAFGHSGLEQGHVVELRGAPGRPSLQATATLPGVPLGALDDGLFLLARAEAGKSRWAQKMSIGSADRELQIDLGEPLLDLVTTGGAPRSRRFAAVTQSYALLVLDGELQTRTPMGSSGAGIALVGTEPRESWVVGTSSIAPGGADAIRLIGPAGAGDPVPLPGLVRASVMVDDPRGALLVVAIAPKKGPRSVLYRMGLDRR